MAAQTWNRPCDEERGFIARSVASGSRASRAKVTESAVGGGHSVEQAEEDVLRPIAERLTLEAVALHLIDHPGDLVRGDGL